MIRCRRDFRTTGHRLTRISEEFGQPGVEAMEAESNVDALRAELLSMVADQLTPVALRYGYSEVPLESNIKWLPLVLVLGNYSSGKSSMINEFLGADIQATGQAPTDDSFTVITYDDSAPAAYGITVTEERDGKVLLNDPEYPFSLLKRHGQRFAAHFRLKKVSSPFLKSFAIIDTPGMLDSITERDRGYKFQDVIGDFARVADLILVLFDPHKAGTIRESHISLRDTLSLATCEDRLVFVLNRIDECSSLEDLIRVYGTLCWNLSQITGRKDIPAIYLTYSPHAADVSTYGVTHDTSYLKYLENQRENLKRVILQSPRRRLDNLATFVETHSERLSHLLESLIGYQDRRRLFLFKHMGTACMFSMICGAAAVFLTANAGPFSGLSTGYRCGIGGIVLTGVMLIWVSTATRYFLGRFHRLMLRDVDRLTLRENQSRQDSWEAVRDFVRHYLIKTGGRFSIKAVRRDALPVNRVCGEETCRIREKISGLSSGMTKESRQGRDAMLYGEWKN